MRRLLPVLFLCLFAGQLFSLKIGYALSGGGARGFAHIGMLKVLEEEGIHPDYISGTSIGAVIGGMYAMGYRATQIESLFVSLDWDYLLSDEWSREELFIGQKRWAPYGNASFRLDSNWNPQLPQSVITGNRINLELFRIFAPASRITQFKDLPIPFTCVATDLHSGRMIAFDHGNLMQCVRASMSIPSILQPFPLSNTQYIDGGISQNLPGKQVSSMGADYVIGLKVNSSLRNEDGLQGLFQVLDQTINIGITSRVEEDLPYCSFVLNPDLEQFSATDFRNVKEIIAQGEAYARAHIFEIRAVAHRLHTINAGTFYTAPTFKPLGKVVFSHIAVQGNKYLSSTKVREYVGLETGYHYNVNQIADNFHRAWNSQLFDIIYPVILPDSEGYTLLIQVKERQRKYLSLNFTYDRENEFVAGAVLALQNYMMKNSLILAQIKAGGMHELNIDVVKNFGEAYGVYCRVFPYINEKRLFYYNDEHERVSSVRSLESGLTAGIGLFAKRSIALEAYGFSYWNRLYREISEETPPDISKNLSGLGLKAYHESLDDFVFPTRGMQGLLKVTTAKTDIANGKPINQLTFSGAIYHPFATDLSLYAGVMYGTHFDTSQATAHNNFYIGGIDGFAGYPHYEINPPYYKLIQAGLVCQASKNLYISGKVQALHHTDVETWDFDKNLHVGGVAEIGYRTYLGPIKAAVAFSKDREAQFYLNAGYTYDIFFFSRR